MAFNDNFVDEIRAKADIVEVISDYLKLELRGKNYLGLCPFHQEKTPSFNVSREKQLYYCFGCGAGGDIFNFLMEIENLPFIEAAKILAERYGVPVPDKTVSPAQRAEEELRDQLFQIHEWTAKFFYYLLMEHQQGKEALAYFEKRGFTRATIEKFRLGYAPQGWTALFHFLQKKGYEPQLLEKSGLVLPSKSGRSESHYDRFRDRAMFSIFNQRGQPIAFGGRVMQKDEGPKYLNSPETLIFEKNQNLYGIHLAKDRMRQTKQAIIMEGYTDVITAHQHGIENAVASLGTSLTENQARLLTRYVEEVYIAYDADTAGQNATIRGLDILKEAGLMVKVITLPDQLDPDDFIREKGGTAFEQCMEDAVSLVDFKLNQIVQKYDIENPDGKVKAVEELLPLFLNIDNAIEKDYLETQIVEQLKVSRQALTAELANFMEEKSKFKDKSDKKWHTKDETRNYPTDSGTQDFRGNRAGQYDGRAGYAGSGAKGQSNRGYAGGTAGRFGKPGRPEQFRESGRRANYGADSYGHSLQTPQNTGQRAGYPGGQANQDSANQVQRGFAETGIGSRESAGHLLRAFEEKFVNAVLRAPGFLKHVFSLVTPESFQDQDCQAIIGQIYAYYQQRGELTDYSAVTTNELLSHFTDEKIRQQALYFSFLYPEHEVSEDYINEGLKKLKEYQKAMEMETILKEIRQIKTNGKLADLNQVLIRYHRMLHHDSGKGGC